MDTGLDENKAELGVLVLAVDLKVLADGDRLFDKVPEILGDLGSKTCVAIDKSQLDLPITQNSNSTRPQDAL